LHVELVWRFSVSPSPGLLLHGVGCQLVTSDSFPRTVPSLVFLLAPLESGSAFSAAAARAEYEVTAELGVSHVCRLLRDVRVDGASGQLLQEHYVFEVTESAGASDHIELTWRQLR
jgi:hypothetical protein